MLDQSTVLKQGGGVRSKYSTRAVPEVPAPVPEHNSSAGARSTSSTKLSTKGRRRHSKKGRRADQSRAHHSSKGRRARQTQAPISSYSDKLLVLTDRLQDLNNQDLEHQHDTKKQPILIDDLTYFIPYNFTIARK